MLYVIYVRKLYVRAWEIKYTTENYITEAESGTELTYINYAMPASQCTLPKDVLILVTLP